MHPTSANALILGHYQVMPFYPFILVFSTHVFANHSILHPLAPQGGQGELAPTCIFTFLSEASCGAFTLDVMSVLNENLDGILGGTR